MKGREVYTRGTTLIASILDANLDHFNGVNRNHLLSISVILLKSDLHLYATCPSSHHPRIACLCLQNTISIIVFLHLFNVQSNACEK